MTRRTSPEIDALNAARLTLEEAANAMKAELEQLELNEAGILATLGMVPEDIDDRGIPGLFGHQYNNGASAIQTDLENLRLGIRDFPRTNTNFDAARETVQALPETDAGKQFLAALVRLTKPWRTFLNPREEARRANASC